MHFCFIAASSAVNTSPKYQEARPHGYESTTQVLTRPKGSSALSHGGFVKENYDLSNVKRGILIVFGPGGDKEENEPHTKPHTVKPKK